MIRRSVLFAAILLGLAATSPAPAQQPDAPRDGLVTRASAHDMRGTLDRFTAAVRETNWVVFTEIDHAAAARAVGMALPGRTVVLFGNPRAGTPAMQANPTLALDLPMRALVWEDARGHVHLTRSSGADIAARVFARHGVTVPPQGQADTERLLEGLARKATE